MAVAAWGVGGSPDMRSYSDLFRSQVYPMG